MAFIHLCTLSAESGDSLCALSAESGDSDTAVKGEGGDEWTRREKRTAVNL